MEPANGRVHVQPEALHAFTRAAAPSSWSRRGSDLAGGADEDRRVPLGVAAGLALPECPHEVHEVGRLLALERGHELLVVDPERVRRVVGDGPELVADAHVLVHRALAVLVRERVPRPHLHERVDDEVRRALGNDLARLARRRVLGRLRRREVRVGRLEPTRQRRRVELGAEVAEVVVGLVIFQRKKSASGRTPVTSMRAGGPSAAPTTRPLRRRRPSPPCARRSAGAATRDRP